MNTDKKKTDNLDDTSSNTGNENTEPKKGSGIFTADGKELPEIEGGYDLINPDSGLGDNDYEG